MFGDGKDDGHTLFLSPFATDLELLLCCGPSGRPPRDVEEDPWIGIERSSVDCIV